MTQISKYLLFYRYSEIYKRFKPHIKQGIYVESHVNNYVDNSMSEYSNDELRVMRETTLKFKEQHYFVSTIAIAVVSAIFALFAILVALSTADNISDDSVLFLLSILAGYVISLVVFFFYVTKKSRQIVLLTNLIEIAIIRTEPRGVHIEPTIKS